MAGERERIEIELVLRMPTCPFCGGIEEPVLATDLIEEINRTIDRVMKKHGTLMQRRTWTEER